MTRCHYVLALATTMLVVLATQWTSKYGEPALHFLRTMKMVHYIGEKKNAAEIVVSKPILEPWPEPESAQVLFNSSTRILWGYWDGGEENMPGFCQLALRSWRMQHPDWHIIILSDENYKSYVSASELPTTFESLKVQHRSDIVRLAVLIRYGGAYMDVSTITFKSFDGIWDEASEEQLFLTAPAPLDNGASMVNNALIFAPGRDNPVLREWQRRVLAYTESPVSTEEAMRAHPAFKRVAHMFDAPGIGIFKDCLPYCALLWLLLDMLQYDEALRPYIKEHVSVLPTQRWTFDFISLSLMGNEKVVVDDPTSDPPVSSWTIMNVMKMMWRKIPVQFQDDPERASRLLEQLNVMKISSANIDFYEPVSYHMERNSTLSRLYRAAISEGPSKNATLKGAMPISLLDEKPQTTWAVLDDGVSSRSSAL